MAHAGTMVGGSAQTKQSGSPWPAIVLAVAVVVVTIAGVLLASSAGIVGGTAKPAADRAFDQIEALRGAVVLSSDRSQAYDEHLNQILNGAHAAPYAVTLPIDPIKAYDEYLNGILNRAHAAPYAAGAARLPLSPTSGTFHPGMTAAGAARLPLTPTSGTFHRGMTADQLKAPVQRDRHGGQ